MLYKIRNKKSNQVQVKKLSTRVVAEKKIQIKQRDKHKENLKWSSNPFWVEKMKKTTIKIRQTRQGIIVVVSIFMFIPVKLDRLLYSLTSGLSKIRIRKV